MESNSVKKQEPVAKLYAKALFELAQEHNELESIQGDLAGLVETMKEQPELHQAFSAFMFSTSDRGKLIDELAKKMSLNALVVRFLHLLVAKNRLLVLDAIYEAFRNLVDESKNTVRGTVTTVEPLTESQTADLSKTFGRKLNKQVVLDSAIDKEILGGLIVKIQGLTFDGSLRTTIRRLKENLERQSI